MGFSVDGSGQWAQTFNWKPSTTAQQIGGFTNSPLIQDFVKAYGTHTEPNLKDYSTTQNYITNMRWKTPFTDAAVQLGNMGGAFSAAKNPEAKYNVFGGTNVDTITGGKLNDFIQGGGGNDILRGEGGNDELWGGAGNDTIHGGEGRDVLYGNDGNDSLNGGGGDDLLLGDEGNDKLYGGNGNDFVFGGKGNDIMTGGANADRFYLSELSGSGTQIMDLTTEDDIWIIDNNNNNNDKTGYSFTKAQGSNDVVIKKGSITLATVKNTNFTADQIRDMTNIGPSRFSNYADTTPQRA
ncbi:MAG: hypothetical protein NWR47_09385 [Aestuariivirgaceae bacterium]|nr:hypothetical protein [Aestuariivirgaceae bacterium]